MTTFFDQPIQIRRAGIDRADVQIIEEGADFDFGFIIDEGEIVPVIRRGESRTFFEIVDD